jgi:two-component system chemotaxis response regulator CheY
MHETEEKTILVVDDTLFIRKMVKIILEILGYTVIEAANGKDGIKMYKKNNPRYVIMDVMMPVINGIKSARSIRKIDPDAFIVFYSSSSDEILIKKALDISPFYVDKMNGIDELLNVMKIGNPVKKRNIPVMENINNIKSNYNS